MHLRLTQANIGATLRVVGYDKASDYTAQLSRLGLVPGTVLQVIRRAPLGDPLQIRVRGYELALRPHEAAALQLEEV